MSKILIPDGLVGKDLFSWLVTNKIAIIAEKKMEIKRADPFKGLLSYDKPDGVAVKANLPISEDVLALKVSSIINSTNLMDSHSDVHLPGLWKKSLSENKDLYLLEEHVMSFKTIISDDIQAFTRSMSWKELGYEEGGMTECLIFVSKLTKDRNPFMFNEYKMGRVKNHSVGMRYVQIELGINDEDHKEDYATWNKYKDQIANIKEAENQGFAFFVKEAKVIEGSAVPIGSNRRTGTLDNNLKSYSEDIQDTQKEPQASTHEEPSLKGEDSEWLDQIRKHTFIKI